MSSSYVPFIDFGSVCCFLIRNHLFKKINKISRYFPFSLPYTRGKVSNINELYRYIKNANSYAISGNIFYCKISREHHWFEWPDGAIRPLWNGREDVLGCGLLLNPKNELSSLLEMPH
jgi:hypothetical protein